MERKYPNLDDKYLNTAMTIVKELKELGLIWPKEEEIFTTSFEKLNNTISSQLSLVPDNFVVNNISRRNQIERDKEALNLIREFFGKDIASLAKIYKDNIISETEMNDKYGVEIYYQREKNLIFPTQVILNPAENSTQSIILASTLLETIKNKNIKEFNYLWKYGKIIPFFLELFFSKNLSFTKENRDLYYVINLFKLWVLKTNNEFYKTVVLKRDDPIYRYLGNVSMVQNIYPFINGYINALKLEKLYRRDPKAVLKKIRLVIENKKTTGEIMSDLQIDKISDNQVIKEKIKELKIGI